MKTQNHSQKKLTLLALRWVPKAPRFFGGAWQHQAMRWLAVGPIPYLQLYHSNETTHSSQDLWGETRFLTCSNSYAKAIFCFNQILSWIWNVFRDGDGFINHHSITQSVGNSEVSHHTRFSIRCKAQVWSTSQSLQEAVRHYLGKKCALLCCQ